MGDGDQQRLRSSSMPPPTARSRRCRSMPAFARQNGWPPSASPIMPAAWASGGAPSSLDCAARLPCSRPATPPSLRAAIPAAASACRRKPRWSLRRRPARARLRLRCPDASREPGRRLTAAANPARLGRRPRRPGGNRPDRPPQACRQRRSEFCCLWSAHANRVRRMAARTRRQAGLAAENSRWTASLVSIRAWELPLSGGMRFWRDIG
jgi:hypothetical protein